MNSKSTAVKRIMADVRELERHPSSRYAAAPLETNCFEWHFTIRGPSGSDFEGGIYHGRIILPSEYPFKPPNIIFLTKNGRFEVGTKICLSISAYHEETWQPAWGVRTMLEAIISFFPSEGGGAIGALEWTREERQRLARESHSFSCPICGSAHALLSAEAADGTDQPDSEIAAQISQLKMAAGGAASAASSMKAGGGGVGESGKGSDKGVTASGTRVGEVPVKVEVKTEKDDGTGSTKAVAGSADSDGGLKEEQSQGTVTAGAGIAASSISSRSSPLKQEETANIGHFGDTAAAAAAINTTNQTPTTANATTATMLPAIDTTHPSSPDSRSNYRPNGVTATTPLASPTSPMSAGAALASTPPPSLSSIAANAATMTTPTSFSMNESDGSVGVNTASSDGVGVDVPPTPPSLRAVRRQVLAERALERAQRGGDVLNNHPSQTATSTVSAPSSTSSSSIAASVVTGNVTAIRTATTITSSGSNNEQQSRTGTASMVAVDQSTGSRAATTTSLTGSDSSTAAAGAVPAVSPPVAVAAPVGVVDEPQVRQIPRQEESDITDNVLGGLQYGIVAAIVAILLRRLLIVWMVASHLGGRSGGPHGEF